MVRVDMRDIQWWWKLINHKSYMKGNKGGKVLCYSYWRTHLHADPHTEKKYIYNNSHINCGNDKNNQLFYHNQFGSYTYYRNYLKHTTVQSNWQVFHRFRLSSYYYIHVFDNHWWRYLPTCLPLNKATKVLSPQRKP